MSAINVHLMRDYYKFTVRLTRAGPSEFELGPEGDRAVAVVGEQRVRFSLEELFRAQLVSRDIRIPTGHIIEADVGGLMVGEEWRA